MNVGSATISVAHGVVAAAAVGPILAACDAIRWRAAILCILPAPTTAQWMYRIPDAPRTTSNAIDLAAPAPRNSAGRVVQTTGFNDRTWLDDVGHPHSDAMRVTERFRRPDFGHLLVEITIEDRKMYSRPWTVTQEFRFQADTELIEYVCNENNRDVEHLVGR